jgi:hypothetical protein
MFSIGSMLWYPWCKPFTWLSLDKRKLWCTGTVNCASALAFYFISGCRQKSHKYNSSLFFLSDVVFYLLADWGKWSHIFSHTEKASIKRISENCGTSPSPDKHFWCSMVLSLPLFFSIYFFSRNYQVDNVSSWFRDASRSRVLEIIYGPFSPLLDHRPVCCSCYFGV